jgi:general secretion pathway protein K
MPSRPAVIASRSRGFALLIVLWTLVLIAFIVGNLTARGGSEIRIASNLVSNAAAQAAADGAVYQTIYILSDPQQNGRWPLDGSAHVLRIGFSQVVVRVSDEAGRINPNTASPALLDALLRVTGSDDATAQNLAQSIALWVGSIPGGPQTDQTKAQYAAAGLSYGPPGEPLQTLGELRRVLGMTPEIFAAIRPHLTLYGPPQPNPQSADPVVAAALALLQQATPNAPNPAFPSAAPPISTVRIAAAADGPGNARANRTVIARVGPMLPGGYVILARDSGAEE